MPFGLFNRTRLTFVKISAFGVDLAWGFVEEITTNYTHVNPANALDIILEASDQLQLPGPKILERQGSQLLTKKYAYLAATFLTTLNAHTHIFYGNMCA